MLRLLIFIVCATANVFDEYNNRAKQAQKELLIDHLKRQTSLRLLGRVSGSSLTYNDILQGLIKQNTAEVEEGSVNDKKYKQLIDERNKEAEQKRMELLRRLAQKEVDADQVLLSDLKREALSATATSNAVDLAEVQKAMQRKWRVQRKALVMLERAREAKHIALLEKLKNQQSPSYASKKRSEYNFKIAQKRNKIASKLILRAQVAQQREKALIIQKRAEIKNSALKSARDVLKQASQRIKKFNFNDDLI